MACPRCEVQGPVSSTLSEAERVEAFSRLRRQMDDLEWLLAKAGWNARRWRVRLRIGEQDDLPVIELVLRHRELGRVHLSSVPDPFELAQGIGARHFWVDGNHWYDEHAVGVLRDQLEAQGVTEKLVRAAEDALSRIETGDVEPLARAIERAKERYGLDMEE